MLRVVSWRTRCVNAAKKEGVTVAHRVETLGVDLNGLGVKEKAMRKKCRLRFSLIEKKNKVLQKNCMKVVVKKLLRAGMVPARTW